jgi:hypothetical protein
MNDNQKTKASYHQPTFSIYGNLTNLTKAGGPNNLGDSNANANNMSMA